jgi:hypothetical protein
MEKQNHHELNDLGVKIMVFIAVAVGTFAACTVIALL